MSIIVNIKLSIILFFYDNCDHFKCGGGCECQKIGEENFGDERYAMEFKASQSSVVLR